MVKYYASYAKITFLQAMVLERNRTKSVTEGTMDPSQQLAEANVTAANIYGGLMNYL